MNQLDFIKSKNFGAQSETVISRKTTHKIGVIIIDGGPRLHNDIESSVCKNFSLVAKTQPTNKGQSLFFSREDP